MSFTISATSSAVEVTGNITLGGTPTAVLKASAAAGASTVDIATVTAGKTAYLIGFILTAAGNGAASNQKATLKDSDGNVIATTCFNGGIGSSCAAYNFPVGYGVSLAATKKFQLTGTAGGAGGEVEASIFYVEV